MPYVFGVWTVRNEGRIANAEGEFNGGAVEVSEPVWTKQFSKAVGKVNRRILPARQDWQACSGVGVANRSPPCKSGFWLQKGTDTGHNKAASTWRTFMSGPELPDLVTRWRESGDQAAAAELFDCYAARLITLVRAHLSEKLARRFDPEDVVQSAFRSFFVGTRDGRLLLRQSGDLWRLLVAISLNKLYRRVELHTAAKRSVAREEFSGIDEAWFQIFQKRLAGGNVADDALALAEEIEHLVVGLDPIEQRMFELRLEGYTLDEIAQDTNRSQRTVRRVMDRIKHEIGRPQPEFLAQ
jgi:RNA polymerase sigma-70 factor (ECF subfamily)